MENHVKHLLQSLKLIRIRRFLAKNDIIRCTEPPSFDGIWPYICNSGKMVLGPRCRFRSARLQQRITVKEGAVLEIGDCCFMNDGVSIFAQNSVIIGANTLIGDMVQIYDTDFHQVSPERPVKTSPIIIGANVWIGAHAIILPGSRIGDHSVIGGGSVVAGEIPGRCVAVGVPARVVKTFSASDDWVRS